MAANPTIKCPRCAARPRILNGRIEAHDWTRVVEHSYLDSMGLDRWETLLRPERGNPCPASDSLPPFR